MIGEEIKKLSEAVSTDNIGEQIKKWKYRTIVYMSKSVELWSYSSNLEIDDTKKMIEVIGNGHRLLLIEKNKIKDIKITEGRSVQIIMSDGSNILIQK